LWRFGYPLPETPQAAVYFYIPRGAITHLFFHSNMIKRINGQANIKPFAKAASTAFDFNDVVTRDSSGYLTKATQTTPRQELLGLIQRNVASTDSDYASNTLVEVDVFEGSGSEDFEADVDAGTAVQSMVGKVFDINDEDGIDVDSNINGAFKIERVLSTTKVRGSVRTDGRKTDLKSYSQTIAFGDFTDGGSTAGTLSLGVSIPVGAVYEATLVDDLTGFAGDTSAVITVGDGTDADRYNTGTPSVFATAAGVAMGVPSGTRYHAAAKTPVVTITSGSDWGAVTAGQLTITLLWREATA